MTQTDAGTGPIPQDADATHDGFGDQVRSAVFWRSGSQMVAQLISWVSTFAVIRILDPSDYGLFAMTQVVLNFMAFLNGYGLVSALVQSESIDSHRLRQAFGLVLILNAGLAALQFMIAPLVAGYYHQPIVADLLRVQAFIYLATPFIALPEAIMGRSLDFKSPAVVNLLTALVGALTAIIGALSGWGVWTLVAAPMAAFWTRAIGFMIATRFFMLPSFDFRGTGPMIAFGASLLGSQLFWLVQSQSDVFIAGRVLDPHQLGLYAEAVFLTQLFVARVIPPLNDVAFPAYARLQNDMSKIAWSFLRALRLIMLIACPFYFGMAVTAGPLIETVLGAKWLGMVPFVVAISFAMPFSTIQCLFAPASNALGRPGITARISAIGAVMMPVLFLIGIQFGPLGLAAAWTIGLPLLMIATIRIAGRIMNVSFGDVIGAVMPAIGASAAMAIVVQLLDHALPILPAPVHLAILVVAGGLAYGALLLGFARPLVNELIGMLRRRKPEPA
ncbi:lipopolysaccharide biosynthesis protein [Sphingobium nicotianae]|uniref:Lipopolysaccharide biosynthesis protein n=1 Tax=Sphingobium nicotianae TaxID=2782607 RepID=A0A9X1DFC4_9SPHN|nr:lipopolysaccharide biosynthesis protein [Sphingobium nicotianae]MBT2188813.1 lipopolysaccharide biosynthesis protein [Sphingobium nicotianae]